MIFYSSGFKRGDVFLIGFYEGNNFFEISKNDSGKVSLLRIESSAGNVFSESFTKDETLNSLKVFWSSFDYSLINKS
ncbi:hypothetical protein GF362_06070 [Candidatus Dojkabacteria bacterium]|nr:hypothetical protein [Candidatus Dojkabacteria bacterium]